MQLGWQSLRSAGALLYGSKKMIPKHSFICWQAVLNMLSTRDRQHKYDARISSGCVFYNLDESRNHLFFSCLYSSQVWNEMASSTCKFLSTSWDALPNWGSSMEKGSLKYSNFKMASQASVYSIWIERNSRIHSQMATSPSSLSTQILYIIKLRLMSLPTASIQSLKVSDPLNLWASEI